jgi:phosphoserine phosphatase
VIDGEAKAPHAPARAQATASRRSVIAAGDGANDLPMLTRPASALPITPSRWSGASHLRLNHCGLDGILNLFA